MPGPTSPSCTARKEIKDAVAYFRLTVNPHDEEALKRVINYPARGIGDTTVGRLLQAADAHNVSPWTVLCAPQEYEMTLNKGTLGKLQAFRTLIEECTVLASTRTAYESGTEIIRRTGIIADICQDNSPENQSRQENIEELANGLSDFCAQRLEEGNTRTGLADFLSEVSLLTDQDTDKDSNRDCVTLMTVHSAKGLEFRNVFVVGLEEGLFPSSMAGDSPRALEEERRLFYVAITRAEEHCYLSYAKSRIRFGKMEFCSPSRFLHDIDARYLDLPDSDIPARITAPASSYRPRQQTFIQPAAPRMKPVSRASATGKNTPAVQEGQLIEHERFGRGTVLRVEGAGENAKATIRFENVGEKQLLLRFARFKVL